MPDSERLQTVLDAAQDVASGLPEGFDQKQVAHDKIRRCLRLLAMSVQLLAEELTERGQE